MADSGNRDFDRWWDCLFSGKLRSSTFGLPNPAITPRLSSRLLVISWSCQHWEIIDRTLARLITFAVSPPRVLPGIHSCTILCVEYSFILQGECRIQYSIALRSYVYVQTLEKKQQKNDPLLIHRKQKWPAGPRGISS